MSMVISNTHRGNLFEAEVRAVMQRTYGWNLHQGVGIGIGLPPKPHRFDLVDTRAKVAIECKAFTWTATGNMPAAKITTAREAVLYLQWLPSDWVKILAMSASTRPGYTESLARYFVRLNDHLLGDVIVIEVDADEARGLYGNPSR
jgi:hypothetical protein